MQLRFISRPVKMSWGSFSTSRGKDGGDGFLRPHPFISKLSQFGVLAAFFHPFNPWLPRSTCRASKYTFSGDNLLSRGRQMLQRWPQKSIEDYQRLSMCFCKALFLLLEDADRKKKPPCWHQQGQTVPSDFLRLHFYVMNSVGVSRYGAIKMVICVWKENGVS